MYKKINHLTDNFFCNFNYLIKFLLRIGFSIVLILIIVTLMSFENNYFKKN